MDLVGKRMIGGALALAGLAGLWAVLWRDRRDAFTIRSASLGETRRYLVDLPPSYQHRPGARYPVLYLLDGGDRRQFSGDIPLYSRSQAVLEKLFARGFPELILVGVDNVNRERDMIPAGRPDLPSPGGGSDRFLSFVAGELIPRIDRRYRSDGTRILYGESYGGLFVLYALGARPDLFDHHLAISPAVGAAAPLVQRLLTNCWSVRPSRPGSLVMLWGEHDAPMVTEYMDGLCRVVAPAARPEDRIVARRLPGAGHNPPVSLEMGLKEIVDLIRQGRQGVPSSAAADGPARKVTAEPTVRR